MKTEKACTKCREVKSLEVFPKAKKAKDGRGSWCKYCVHTQYSARVKAKKYYQKPEYKRRSSNKHLQRMYGITLDDYDAMLAEQGGVCAICGTNTPEGNSGRFFVDHCHTTGKIRSLLCLKCNTGIGFFKDSPHVLRTAALYLERHQ